MVDGQPTEDWILDAVGAVTGEPEGLIRRRIQAERRRLGSNARLDFAARGLTPHLWNEALDRFYRESAAPLYEGIVWNQTGMKRAMREWISGRLATAGRPLSVLCFGDGCGFESLRLARDGQRVCYCDVPGPSSRFARRLFAAAQVAVRIADQEAPLERAAFDAVICLDVLEHCPDPPAIVARLTQAIKPGGVLVAAAPFFLVTRDFPSHLRSGVRYSGALAALYGKAGLALRDGALLWDPLVWAKDASACWLKPASALKLAALRAAGPLFSCARLSTLPFAAAVELDQACRWLRTTVTPA